MIPTKGEHVDAFIFDHDLCAAAMDFETPVAKESMGLAQCAWERENPHIRPSLPEGMP